MAALTVLLPTLLLAILAFIWQGRRQFHARSKGFPHPPGPPKLPFIGNVLDIPKHYMWRTFLEWKQSYGDLIYVEGLGNRLLIINTIEAANNLLVKRATNYSNRPRLVMVGELMDIGKSIPLHDYGSELRHHRKLYHIAMGPDNCKMYIRAQEDAVALFLDAVLQNPSDFENQTRLTAGRIIMSTVYGIPATTPVHMFLKVNDELMKLVGEAIMPGAFLVDLIPALRYLPSWVPFQKVAKRGKELALTTINKPFDFVQDQRRRGIGQPSCTSQFLDVHETETGGVDAETELSLKWASGSLYAPGAETTYGVSLVFMHAMAIFPDVQKKIQAEIDAVVGSQRLPTVADRPNLPYVCAAIKEALRWNPVAPVGVGRSTSNDDFYNGYFIPAKTTVITNVWAISRDDKSGIPPEEFAPERFLMEDPAKCAVDPYTYAFGFARRECPGRYVADNSLFLIISGLMAATTICQAKSAQGGEKPVDPVYVDGLIRCVFTLILLFYGGGTIGRVVFSYPENFEVDFKCRNKDLAVAWVAGSAMGCIKATTGNPVPGGGAPLGAGDGSQWMGAGERYLRTTVQAQTICGHRAPCSGCCAGGIGIHDMWHGRPLAGWLFKLDGCRNGLSCE